MASSTKSDLGVQVIGAGLMRTGTASLKMALEKLLGGKCYHMSEVYANPRQSSKWVEADESGLYDSQWREFLSGYLATTDYPSCAFYDQLVRVFPQSKVILSLREPRSWVRSCRNTTMSREFYMDAKANLLSGSDELFNIHTEMVRRVLAKSLNCKKEDFANEAMEDTLVERFIEWNEDVKKTIPPERLLIFEAGMGWEPLCKFMNVPVPDEPYPKVNSTQSFQQTCNPS